METPYLPLSLFEKDFEKVYQPAEDTFLLLDALEKDLDYLERSGNVCLEVGSGSGTIITAMSKTLKGPRLMIATDVNPEACKTTKKCAIYHNQRDIQIIRTNLAESLVDRMRHQVDVLIFNPPYVPTDPEEKLETSKEIQLSWAGGDRGRRLTDQFLRTYVPQMMNKPNGVAYLIALEQNNVPELLDFLAKDHKIQGSIVIQRKAGLEMLFVIKYSWI